MIFLFLTISDKYIGEYILDVLGISFSHTTIGIYLFILSIFIGYRYKDHPYAK